MNLPDQRLASGEIDVGAGPVARLGVLEQPALPAVMGDTLGAIVDGVAEMDRVIATAAAWRAELVDQARQWSELTERATMPDDPHGWDPRTVARRVLVTELACALRIPERTAETLIAHSEALIHDLPATYAALREGAISYRHAQTMVDHASSVPDAARDEFEAAVLPSAKTMTVAKFDRKARVARERLHPETIATRHAAAAGDRQLRLQPARDGMAWLSAFLPAATAHGIFNRVTDTAVSLQCPVEARTLTQLRADVFADLLIDGATEATGCSGNSRSSGSSGDSGGSGGIRARVLVTVPVLTLLGHGDEPGTLEGYGPIDPDTARRLAAHAPSFTRILTHPETGTVLSVGRDRYAVPSDLRTWLRVRDETCRFPGCNRGAARCDLDHTDDWGYDGQTEHDNLAHLCRSHHRVKHQTRWSVTQARDGTLTWTAPSGHHYQTHPETRIERANPPPPT